MEKHQFRAEWIWEKENTVPNDTVVFRKTFILDNIPKNAISYAAVDTKYWLFINGKMAVFEGGLFRESLVGWSGSFGYSEVRERWYSESRRYEDRY